MHHIAKPIIGAATVTVHVMPTAPLLILAFNRPRSVARLLASLHSCKPGHIIFAVDGPRGEYPADAELVEQTRAQVQMIDWNCRVETMFRDTNLGLRHSVADAVGTVVQKHGEVIVVEDDVVVGPNFLPYMQWALERHREDTSVAHLNGYNVVPPGRLTRPIGERRTRYVESFAWATWARSWSAYDPTLEWALDVPVRVLGEYLGSLASAVRWKRNFRDAADDLINTWAYRWIASIWSMNWSIVSPSESLVRYTGWDEGTHTSRRAKWTELAVSDLPVDLGSADWVSPPGWDYSADRWLGKSVFGESWSGVVEGFVASGAMSVRRALSNGHSRC